MVSVDNIIFSIQDEQDYHKININQIESSCQNMLQFFLSNEEWVQKSPIAEFLDEEAVLNFDLLICDNDTIQEINAEYRGKDTPTDVISFALFTDSEVPQAIFNNQLNLGQIIISFQKVDEQAKEHNKTFDQELYFLLAHGMLHLLGFTHDCEESYLYMMDTQEKMLEIFRKKYV